MNFQNNKLTQVTLNIMSLKRKDASSSAKDGDTYVAAISYLWILCLVPLFLKRDNEFIQAHAKQGLVLFIAEIAGTVVFWIPFIGWALFLFCVIASAYGISQALQGKTWEIPIIGKYAHKLSI